VHRVHIYNFKTTNITPVQENDNGYTNVNNIFNISVSKARCRVGGFSGCWICSRISELDNEEEVRNQQTQNLSCNITYCNRLSNNALPLPYGFCAKKGTL